MQKQTTTATRKLVKRFLESADERPIEFALALAKWAANDGGKVMDLARDRPAMRRRLYYLMEVGRWLMPLKLTMPRLAQIGWTKLQIVADHIKKHPTMSASKALAYAETYTAAQLPAILKGGPEPLQGARTHHAIMLRLTPAQYKVFEAVLLKHGATKQKAGRGLVNKENAVTEVMRRAAKEGWMSSHLALKKLLSTKTGA